MVRINARKKKQKSQNKHNLYFTVFNIFFAHQRRQLQICLSVKICVHLSIILGRKGYGTKMRKTSKRIINNSRDNHAIFCQARVQWDIGAIMFCARHGVALENDNMINNNSVRFKRVSRTAPGIVDDSYCPQTNDSRQLQILACSFFFVFNKNTFFPFWYPIEEPITRCETKV